jgi:hypothetical protein
MKIYRFFLVLLCFVVSQNSFGQDPLLFEGTWELYSLEIDGEQFLPPSNEEVEAVILSFQEENESGLSSMSTNVCNALLGYLTFEEEGMPPSFLLYDPGETLIFCDIPENSIFEDQYFTFYLNNRATHLGLVNFNLLHSYRLMQYTSFYYLV